MSFGDHFYDPVTKEPRHFIEKKDGSGTRRPTTVRDARKNGWLPSATTILKAANKPALTAWLCRNAAIAAVTTPRIAGEALDAFVERILARDATDESEHAKNKGTAIHDAIEWVLGGKQCSKEFEVYVTPVLAEAKSRFGVMRLSEEIVIGDGYAGKLDVLFELPKLLTVVDFKSAKTLPKKAESYFEHQMQLAAYAMALANVGNCRIQTANIYISTSAPGELCVCVNEDWQRAGKAFRSLRDYWMLANDFQIEIPQPKELQ